MHRVCEPLNELTKPGCNHDKFVGPIGLLNIHRYMADGSMKPPASTWKSSKTCLFRCRTSMNCADVCPKHFNPTEAIGKIKELMVRRAI